MGRLVVRDEARDDVLDIAGYLAKDSLEAALRFMAATERDFARLADMPGMGQRRRARNSALQGLRSLPVGGFRKYLIFYLPLPDGIEVVRVWHGARDLRRFLDEFE